MTRPLTSILLAVAGFVLFYIGTSVMLTPQAFYASNAIVLTGDASQLSEIRAPAGLLLVSGVLLGFGALRRELTRTSLVVAAVVYGTYGLSRVASILLDGWPSSGLVSAMAIELVVGGLAAVAWLVSRPERS
ncbi:MAG: DUF4345 domain-containing protein [Myxococcota bacterium]